MLILYDKDIFIDLMAKEKEKTALRGRLLTQRSFIYDLKSKALIDNKVLASFEELINEKSPKTVGLYRNFGSELDTEPLDKFLRSQNITVYYPKIQEGNLVFIQSKSRNDFKAGLSGFLEPIGTSDDVIPEVIVVPALATDKEFFRLGYGKGFYDRFIAENQNSFFLSFILKNFIVKSLPRDPWDRKINKVIAINIPSSQYCLALK